MDSGRREEGKGGMLQAEAQDRNELDTGDQQMTVSSPQRSIFFINSNMCISVCTFYCGNRFCFSVDDKDSIPPKELKLKNEAI